MQLRVDGPGIGDTFLTERNLSGDLTAPISLRRNGRYTVYMKGVPTGHVYDSSTFTVRIPPAAPSGVSARVSSGKLLVSWNLGLEDDLSGYALSGSGVGSRSGSAKSFCSGTHCSARLPITRSSGSVSVSVRAQRPTGTGGSLYSSTVSASALVGGGTGGGGSSTSPITPPSYPSGTTSPNGSTPLTPFNNESPVTLPSVQPSGATPGFAYPTPKVADSPRAQNIAATEQLQWGKSIGIALVLLIAAGHLGTWTRKLRVAQAGMSRQGMAARIARGGTGRKRVRTSREHIARAEAIAKTAPLKTAPLKTALGKPALGKPALGKPAKKKAPRSGDTAVPASLRPRPNTKTGRRRPASLGKGASGVSVRIAKPNSERNTKKRHSAPGHRRRK